MWKAFKQIPWKTWLAAFFVWFIFSFAFLGALQDAWGGEGPARIADVLRLQAGIATMVFQAVATVPFQLGQVVFYALLSPILIVPILALFLHSAGRWLKRQSNVRVWLQAVALWFALAGIVSAAYEWASGEDGSRFFAGLFFLVFGPFLQILTFLGGPSGSVATDWPWWLSLLVCPLFWVPASHRLLRIWHRSRANAGKERPLPEPHPELEDASNEGL